MSEKLEPRDTQYGDAKSSVEGSASGRSDSPSGSARPQEAVLDTRPRFERFYRSTLFQIIIVGLCSFSAPGL